jgi:hypothetical protein
MVSGGVLGHHPHIFHVIFLANFRCFKLFLLRSFARRVDGRMSQHVTRFAFATDQK